MSDENKWAGKEMSEEEYAEWRKSFEDMEENFKNLEMMPEDDASEEKEE